jgi:hypothetical protein
VWFGVAPLLPLISQKLPFLLLKLLLVFAHRVDVVVRGQFTGQETLVLLKDLFEKRLLD